jgi:hypothetical protein
MVTPCNFPTARARSAKPRHCRIIFTQGYAWPNALGRAEQDNGPDATPAANASVVIDTKPACRKRAHSNPDSVRKQRIAPFIEFGAICGETIFATALLPFVRKSGRTGHQITRADFLGPLLSRLECRIHRGGRILLHARQDVAIEVERNPHLGVP